MTPPALAYYTFALACAATVCTMLISVSTTAREQDDTVMTYLPLAVMLLWLLFLASVGVTHL